ncbi:fructosamine kinase family protein [Alkalihalobacillus sp. CinArs1]|uniref:fructosamine kinase family protein n=1 Tax=Alkalihalobacillus sp. CinArs1 TaxID=2995314 RepID=UPI0022DCE9E9|nr:fructosamine kinase family protein [Alkalihalobacillus sp. CinArs1]
MISQVRSALQAYGDDGKIDQWDRVTGGSINHTFYAKTSERDYFVKYNPSAGHEFFQAEVNGLTLLGENGVPVPKPLYHHDGGVGNNVLLLEWIPPFVSGEADKELGSVVANMHTHYSKKAGLEHNNFIGELPQTNERNDWVQFYRDQRIGFLQSLAEEKGVLTKERNRLLTKLRDNLHSILNHTPKNSLLHGDLWGGNWISSKEGPVLIDPAVYYGDREVDIAFTYLFGGYSEAFYRRYEEEYPLEDGYKDRFPIYQLYYLLVHLVIFGESYGSAVDRILRRYTTAR